MIFAVNKLSRALSECLKMVPFTDLAQFDSFFVHFSFCRPLKVESFIFSAMHFIYLNQVLK